MQKDPDNNIFNIASDLVRYTSMHVFLTGKAGTGKTTFLRHLKESLDKRAVVVAPTGVAAINAGGVTMHSFFQLPFGPYLPAGGFHFTENVNVADRSSLLKNIRFSSAKRELLRELELLIIDEVSMVRCDMLDAVDTILRHFRKQPYLPFGGVQVLYIGDLFQLPPVIPPHEWNLLKDHYEGPFFFQSKVAQEARPLYIELKKIYRQSDQEFIDILNNIRNNIARKEDLEILNRQFDPEFIPGSKFITLTTHNYKADATNEQRLRELEGRPVNYNAVVEGDFPEKFFPTEAVLKLKVGAQVMFIKNDSGEERKFYNGKLAVVKELLEDEIIVEADEGTFSIEKETWKNIRYELNAEKNEIEETEIGNFKQFPLRLAWAITIHKSQGLSFDYAVIDAGSAFAPGQVYVGLSRCTSLEGLVLHSRIAPNAISTDERVLGFAMSEANDDHLKIVLEEERKKFQVKKLLSSFSLMRLLGIVDQWKELIEEKNIPGGGEALHIQNEVFIVLEELDEVEKKFIRQMEGLINSGDVINLGVRLNKALQYFGGQMEKKVLQPVWNHYESIQYASRMGSYRKEVEALVLKLVQYMEGLNKISFEEINIVPYSFDASRYEFRLKPTKPKAEKGSSKKETLLLFRTGADINTIAKKRNLATGTVESHLASLVGTGDIEIGELMDEVKIREIQQALESNESSLSAVKSSLPDNYSYYEIRAVINHFKYQQELQNTD